MKKTGAKFIQRDDMLPIMMIDRINNTSECCRLSASGSSRYKDKTFRKIRKVNDPLRDSNLSRIWQREGNDSNHNGQRTTLLICTDTET